MKWRLLLHGKRGGAINMAVDDAMLATAIAHPHFATVRLYTWRKPTLSIGYRQRIEDACDLEACRARGIDVVRRVSGGRAVLHHDELTYSVVAPSKSFFRGLSVRGTYAWTTAAIRDGLSKMGLVVDPAPSPAEQKGDRERTAPRRLPCFAVPTGHEITVGGNKLVGSAQKWGRTAFLQHGSVLLSLDRRLWRLATGLPAESTLPATALDEALGRRIDLGELRRAMVAAFEDAFRTPPFSRELTAGETKTIRRLTRAKFASASWTRNRRIGEPREA